MNLRTFIFLSARVFIIWLVLSIIIFITGKYIIGPLLPYISFITDIITDKFTCGLSIEKTSESTVIQCIATMSQDIYIENIPIAPAGYQLTSHTNLIHSLVPIVILFTILLAWPKIEIRHRIILCFFGTVGVLVIIGTVVPILLAGHIEHQLLSAAEKQSGHLMEAPLVMDLVIFFETGGRWIYPVIIAGLCMLIMSAVSSKPLFQNLSNNNAQP